MGVASVEETLRGLDHAEISMKSYITLAKYERRAHRAYKLVLAKKKINQMVEDQFNVTFLDNGDVWVDPMTLLKYMLDKLGYSEGDGRKLEIIVQVDGRCHSRKRKSVLIVLRGMGKDAAKLGCFPLGIFKCKESYADMEIHMRPLIDQLEEACITLAVDTILCGDWKFMNAGRGIAGCTGNFPCFLCCQAKVSFCDFDAPVELRSVENPGPGVQPKATDMWKFVKDRCMDRLHLLLRVTDFLLFSLLSEALHNCIGLDAKSNEQALMTRITAHIQTVLNIPSFTSWEINSSNTKVRKPVGSSHMERISRVV
jgi:hypothetical protein